MKRRIKLHLGAFTLEFCRCGKHPRVMAVSTLVAQHRLGRSR